MAQPSMTIDEAMREAAQLASRGDTDRAKHLYNLVLQQQPAHKKAKKALKALGSKHSAALSQSDFERVAQLMQQGKLPAARAEAQRLCRQYPEQPALHNLHGVILSRQAHKDAALEAFQRALSLEPTFAEALNNSASTLTDLGRFSEALRCYQELVNRGQADADIYANLARALRGSGALEAAREALHRALRLKPVYPDALNDLGNLLNAMGQHPQAIEAYENTLQMDPTHRKALLNLARSWSAGSAYAKAIEQYKKLLALDEGNHHALRGIANAYLSLGDRDQAQDFFQRLLAVRPEDAVGTHMLAALSGQALRSANAAYAEAVFNNFAENFEQHLTGALEYRLPERIPALLETVDGEDAWYSRTLDLGCGTGLVGTQIRSYCDHLSGVDVSPAMLEKAGEKAVYDDILVGDINRILKEERESFDLVLCADVLIYFGELGVLFPDIARRCKPGARFLLSTETLAEGDFRLLQSGRFAHSVDYVERCAAAAGFALLHREDIPLRKEGGEWLRGNVFILALSAH
ncbi:MAG: putative TPR repeat methyltransferase [Halieaceae bacterium]|jgi:predicted TPR repeat methyltransferase